MPSPTHPAAATRAPAKKPVVRAVREKPLPEQQPPSDAEHAFVLSRVPGKKAKGSLP